MLFEGACKFVTLDNYHVLSCHNIVSHNWHTHSQLDVAMAELDIYKEKFTSGEKQLKEAQNNLKETKEAIREKQKWESYFVIVPNVWVCSPHIF